MKIFLIILLSIIGLFILFVIIEFLLSLLSVILFGKVSIKMAKEVTKARKSFWETHERKYIQEEIVLTVENYIKNKNQYNIVKEEVVHNWDDNKEFIKITYEYPIVVRKRS